MSKDVRDRGVVVFWNTAAGYGFIRPDSKNHNGDVFLHGSQLPRGQEIRIRDRVAFDVAPDKRNHARVMATDVEVLPQWREDQNMNRHVRLRGDVLATAAMLAVVAVCLWFMP